MLRIAITGGVACGKSVVGQLFGKKGIPVRDADALAHEVMRRDGHVFSEIVNRFGAEIVGPDGEIDRRKLGEVVFKSPARRNELNGMVHPLVVNSWTAWLTRQEAARKEAAAVEVPLLFEAGLEGGWDATVCVIASREVQLSRLRMRGWSEEQAEARLVAQWPTSEKAARSDYVIENSGEPGMLTRQVERVISRMLEK